VLSVTLAIGWYCLLPGEYAQLGKYTAASALFFPNLALLAESGYFDAASQIKPLLT
jgi:peptidoglycan/LPS O-acetylase OafA/YrhL